MAQFSTLLTSILAAEGDKAAVVAASGGININLWIIAYQVIAFLLLILAMRAWVIGPVLKVIDERRARIEESMVNAEQIKRDLTAAQDNSQRILNEARTQAQQNIANAQKQGETLLAQSRSEAQQQGSQLISRAQQEIEAQKEQAKAELRQEVASLAIMAAGRVVRQNLNSDTNRRLVDEALVEAEQSGSRRAG